MDRHRSPLVIAGGSLLLVAALGAAVLLSWSEANHPAEADLISQRCQGFTRATIWFAYRAGPMDSNYKWLLHATADGRLAADSVAGSGRRVSWDGQQATVATASRPTPRVDEDLGQVIADVWAECRNGFAGSTWSQAAPPADSATRTAYWLRLELPFPWAQEIQTLVGYTPGSGELQQLVILTSAGEEIENVTLVGENWTASFPDQALGPDVPPFLPPQWPGWTQVDTPYGDGEEEMLLFSPLPVLGQ